MELLRILGGRIGGVVNGEKDIYIGLCSSLIFNIFLVILIVFFEPVCEREHLNTIDKSGNMVDSEEMAVELACACLNLDYDAEAPQNAAYDAEAVYHDTGHEWIVILTLKDSGKDEKRWS